jgi:hypothetical protein
LTACSFLLEAEAAEAEAAEVEAAEAEAAEAEAAEAEAAEVEAAVETGVCIGGGGMHWKRRNALEEHGSGQS